MIGKILKYAMIIVLANGCGAGDDEENVNDSSKTGFTPGGTGTNNRTLTKLNITVGPRSGSFSLAGETFHSFGLASATAFTIQLTGCSTGWTTTATSANPTLEVYKDDNNCLAKLTTFDWDSKTWIPKTDFTTWATNDTAIFQRDTDANDTMEVRVGSTLDNPVSGTEAITYYFYEIENGGTTTVLSNDVGDPHALTTGGQNAPNYTIYSVTFNGTSGTGAGQFTFVLECGVDIASNACSGEAMSDTTYKLVEDTYTSAPTLAQAKTAFSTAGTSITIPGDVIAVGAGGTTHGGFTTVSLDGPDAMHNNPNMILFLRQDGASDGDTANDSFTYFNVDVQVLTYP